MEVIRETLWKRCLSTPIKPPVKIATFVSRRQRTSTKERGRSYKKNALKRSFSCLRRADKGWAVKRARPSKKVWCSGLGLCLEMSLVFHGQGLWCGLYFRPCPCHWIMMAWFVFLHFFLVPLCWDAVSERQMLLFFARGLIGLDKYLFQRVSLLPLLYHWIIFSFYYSPMSMLFQNKNN